jgi:hypothetical protein
VPVVVGEGSGFWTCVCPPEGPLNEDAVLGFHVPVQDGSMIVVLPPRTVPPCDQSTAARDVEALTGAAETPIHLVGSSWVSAGQCGLTVDEFSAAAWVPYKALSDLGVTRAPRASPGPYSCEDRQKLRETSVWNGPKVLGLWMSHLPGMPLQELVA